MSCKPMQHCTQLMGDLVRIVETNCKVRDKKHKSQVKWKYPKMAQSHPSVHLEHPDQVMEEDQRTWAVAPKIHPRQSSSCSRPGLKMIKPVHYLLIIWSLSTSCCTSSIHPDGWNEILAFSKRKGYGGHTHGGFGITFLVLLFVLSTWRDYSSLQGDTLLLNNNG